MQEIKNWVLAICAAAILCALFDLLFPKGKTEKAAKLVLSLFFLCVLLLPALSQWKRSDWEEMFPQTVSPSTWEELNATVEQQVLSRSKTALEEAIATILAKENITPEKISVIVNIDQEGYITMERTDIYLPREESAKISAVREIVAQQTGATVNVFVAGKVA